MNAPRSGSALTIPAGRWYEKVLAVPPLALGLMLLYVALGGRGTEGKVSLPALVNGMLLCTIGGLILCRGGTALDPRRRIVTRYWGWAFRFARETFPFDAVEAVWVSPRNTKDRIAGMHYTLALQRGPTETVLRKFGRYEAARALAAQVAATLGFVAPAREPLPDQPWQAVRPSPAMQAAAPPAAPASDGTATLPTPAAAVRRFDLEGRFKRGTGWFYWIGVLSLINSVLAMSKSTLTFVIGLGITQVIAGIGVAFEEKGMPGGRYAAFIVEVAVSLTVIGFGVLARRGQRWAIILGMVLYALDAVLLALFQDWFAFGFHLLALWGLYGGLKALGALRRSRQAEAVPSGPAPPAAPPGACAS